MVATFPRGYFTHTVSVYARPSGGNAAFSTALKVLENVPIRLSPLRLDGAATAADRAALAAKRKAIWPPTVAIPEPAMLLASDGTKWSLDLGSYADFGRFRRADAIRVTT
jgi:hypothetical protein